MGFFYHKDIQNMAYQQLLLMLIVLAILYDISAQKDTLATGQYVLLHIVTQYTPVRPVGLRMGR